MGPSHRKKPQVEAAKVELAKAPPAHLQPTKKDPPVIAPAAPLQKKTDAAIAADSALKEKAAGCWKPIGIPACGPEEFQEIWQRIWEERSGTEKLSETMDRCIQVCERDDVDVAIPPPFQRAWKEIADNEFQEEMEPFYAERRERRQVHG